MPRVGETAAARISVENVVEVRMNFDVFKASQVTTEQQGEHALPLLLLRFGISLKPFSFAFDNDKACSTLLPFVPLTGDGGYRSHDILAVWGRISMLLAVA